MVVFILCPECSEGLGEIYPFFEKVKESYIEHIMKTSGKKIDVDTIDLKANVLENFSFIFEALNIKN
jgi:hypothetical protein